MKRWKRQKHWYRSECPMTYQIQGGDFNNGFFWGGCVGGIIGAIIGIKLHFKTQRQYQDVIDQIEDLTAE